MPSKPKKGEHGPSQFTKLYVQMHRQTSDSHLHENKAPCKLRGHEKNHAPEQISTDTRMDTSHMTSWMYTYTIRLGDVRQQRNSKRTANPDKVNHETKGKVSSVDREKYT